MLWITAAMATAFAAVHLFNGKLRFLDASPRSRFLSFAGGAAVAYVFLHVLPELAEHRMEFAAGMQFDDSMAETVVYGVAMIGLAAFYGLERLIGRTQAANRAGAELADSAQVQWVHLGSFALYNMLIGYLLTHREDSGVWSLVLYFTAMQLHFVTTDHALRVHHRAAYRRMGRWVLSAAIMIGWAVGTAVTFSDVTIGLLFAFLAGGVVLNVMKEELPEERDSSFGTFAIGMIGYAALLLSEKMVMG